MQDDDVRRLLAEARHDEPLPDDVAERLDRVLAGLAAEEPGRPAPVVDLAVQRRRRRARNLLVAAAAVVAVGVGLGQLDLTSSRSSDDSAGASGGSASSADQPAAAPEAGAEYDATDGTVLQDDRLDAPAPADAGPLVLRGADLASVSRLQRLRRGAERTALDADSALPLTTSAAGPGCEAGPYGPGELLAVEYAGNPAVLAFRPPTGDSVVVELLRCGSADVLRSTTIPVP